MKVPVIDLSECVDCAACIEMCSTVFRRNALGFIEIVELFEYIEDEVEEAIKNCPMDCITWDEV